MIDTNKQPNIRFSCHQQNRLVDLQNLSQGLERCQKSLNDYLDSKRNAFPRFFFISDDELLSILGSSDPECVQEHMIKVSTVLCYFYTHLKYFTRLLFSSYVIQCKVLSNIYKLTWYSQNMLIKLLLDNCASTTQSYVLHFKIFL